MRHHPQVPHIHHIMTSKNAERREAGEPTMRRIWLPIVVLLAARAHSLTGPRPPAATKRIPRRDLLVFGAAATAALGSTRPAAASFGSARASVTSPPKLKQGVDLQGFEALGPGKQAQVETLLLPSQAEQLLQEINTQRLELQAASELVGSL